MRTAQARGRAAGNVEALGAAVRELLADATRLSPRVPARASAGEELTWDAVRRGAPRLYEEIAYHDLQARPFRAT